MFSQTKPHAVLVAHIHRIAAVGLLIIAATAGFADSRDAMTTMPPVAPSVATAEGHSDPASFVKLEGANSHVLSGIQIRTVGNRIVVSPGVCKVNGERIETAEAEFTIPPAGGVRVIDEEYVLSSDTPNKWASGTHLKGCVSLSTVLPGCLVPGSVVVKLADGTIMEPQRDYLIDEHWAVLGRLASGRITTEAKTLISYTVGQMRLDAVEVDKSGKLHLKPGQRKKNSPHPPQASDDRVRLAHVFMPYGASEVKPWQVFAIGPPFPKPDAAELQKRAAQVPNTLAKLQAGKEVVIVAWGDSVTAGCDASTKSAAFPERFTRLLGERFPSAKVRLVNAAIGGSNTAGRLPNIEADVLAHKPDLVTIEYVNDIGLPVEVIRQNFEAAVTAIRKAGGEPIIVTPHFVMPEWMGHPYSRGKENREGVTVMREVGKKHNVAVADAAARWDYLETEGIPYLTYLDSGINHPDDRGHDLFVQELLTFFPAQ